MEKRILNNNIEIPILGFGTYQMLPSITEDRVLKAIKNGYRLIDTAQCYGNEQEVGKAIRKSGIPRGKLFVTTKLWGTYGYQDTLESINSSLNRLNVDYIDLLLIHEPTGNITEIYRAMEEAYKQGKAKAIGLSNFNEDHYLKIINNCKIIPSVNQLETHIFRQQDKMRDLEEKYGTLHESWSPLACRKNNILDNEVIQKIATAHHKTTAQVCLRFLTQQGIIVIPKTTHEDRMIENLESLNFDLTNQELEELKKLEIGVSQFNWW